jgi:hypothetical protein
MKSLVANRMPSSALRNTVGDYDYIAKALECPIDPNHAPRHPALAIAMATEARARAEVYCFDEPTARIAFQMMNSHRRQRLVLEQCRPPYKRMFFEYQHERGYAGIFTEGNRTDCRISVIEKFADIEEPLLSLTIPHANFDAMADAYTIPAGTSYYTYEYGPMKTQDWAGIQHAKLATRLVAAFWTFLSQAALL